MKSKDITATRIKTLDDCFDFGPIAGGEPRYTLWLVNAAYRSQCQPYLYGVSLWDDKDGFFIAACDTNNSVHAVSMFKACKKIKDAKKICQYLDKRLAENKYREIEYTVL